MIYVVIPVYNRLKLTINCLQKNFPEITILSGNGSLFWGGAINKGIEYVITIAKYNDWILIVNNDIELAPNAIEELLNTAEKKKRKSLVGALTISSDDRQKVIKSGTVVKSWLFNWTHHIFMGLNINQVILK